MPRHALLSSTYILTDVTEEPSWVFRLIDSPALWPPKGHFVNNITAEGGLKKLTKGLDII